ncbi:Transcription factor GTE10 [Acorus gramineus]|uniref:Transcription factor GTE10 n=1 Tax=Acorus gramineus TaxID=55184 RepID=A0AAV9AS40_ACOGR|nr:Transcription factor GTE10 [Acorus gramineus]
MVPTFLPGHTQKTQSKKVFGDWTGVMMGKMQRSSRGYSSGFVPEYRHAVETVGESEEGFGSSGRVDPEGSEDSCAPKRKCISLNADRCEYFNVPRKVYSVSKMLRAERKELEHRLRLELEQIQALQNKIAARFSSGVALSSTSDAKPEVKKKTVSEKKVVQLGKNEAPSKLKRGLSGRFELGGHTAPLTSTADAMRMKQCDNILNKLMTHDFGWVFNTPVDVVKLQIPDYFNVIKHPMDLGTIKSKIASGVYSSPSDFLADVRLTFTNAKTYNPPGNDVHIMADTLSKFFEVRWKPIEKKLRLTEPQPGPMKSGASIEAQPMVAKQERPPSKKRKTSSANPGKVVPPVSAQQKMTREAIDRLRADLESLECPPDRLLQFLGFDGQNGLEETEIEIDIESFSDEKLFAFQRLMDDIISEKKKELAKVEPCEIEILNDSGVSNSSMQPCKGNEPADEDVDIGGNDPPLSAYPPVEIKKDTAHRNSKCGSSSSSSSDSGSSSSGSDSGSSSGSESVGARAQTPTNISREALGPVSALDMEKSDLMNPPDGNRSISGSGKVDTITHTNAVPVEVDNSRDGENAPPERQVSPDKLYRAALLRNRFADTILKAREKTLDQAGDPEKLRQEREELERKQREEKARLQAEAKAAEDARRQAEAEAAAEAKRKRELEREAARQALLKIERTVEINENSKFLKDLEMLRAAPGDHLPSSVDETIPDHMDDGMGGFNLGCNPLEQLGLYMKVDDEEEEEVDVDPPTVPVNNGDVEEGEID